MTALHPVGPAKVAEPRPLSILGWAMETQASGNYRIGMPMWAMQALGHDARAVVDFNPSLLPDLDVLVAQRLSNGDAANYWHRTALDPSRDFAMVFEMDDDLWNLDPTNPLAGHYATPEVREAFTRSVQLADAVTVSTDHLADVVSQHNKNVYVVPNCIDRTALEIVRPRRDDLTVGWAGSPTHEPDFRSVQKELTAFLRRHPNVGMHFIGSDYRALVGRPNSRLTAWSPNLSEYLRAIDFDIGIAPLAYQPFNKSKSDIKFLEYAALGIPIVASNFGPYAGSIEHGITGFLAKHPHEWTKYLRLLVNDEALRAEIGNNARAWAASRTIQANAWRWEQVYRQVAA